MIVELNIKLNRMNSVQITLSWLVVAIDIWDRALSSQNLSHVIILNVAESLFVIFITSADKIMKIVDQREYTSVHVHKLN